MEYAVSVSESLLIKVKYQDVRKQAGNNKVMKGGTINGND